jgi:putative transposase
MYKADKFRLKPNTEQEIALAKSFGCCRWFWHYSLNLCQETYKATGKGLTRGYIQGLLPSRSSSLYWGTKKSWHTPRRKRTWILLASLLRISGSTMWTWIRFLAKSQLRGGSLLRLSRPYRSLFSYALRYSSKPLKYLVSLVLGAENFYLEEHFPIEPHNSSFQGFSRELLPNGAFIRRWLGFLSGCLPCPLFLISYIR